MRRYLVLNKLNKKTFNTFLKEIPKAEIHIHIEAVISLNSVKKMYKNHFNKEMTKEDQDNLFNYNDLTGFIKSFLFIQSLYQSVDDFDLVFKDFTSYLVKNNITYCEAFFAPSAFLQAGMHYQALIENFKKNIAKIKEKHGIIIKLLVDVSRTFGCDNAMKNYNLLKEFPSDDIIGIGLGGAEAKGPAAEFKAVFEQAHKDGFHAVAHAGEDIGPESIWDSLKLLNAERIGHGITSIQDPKIMAYLRENQIPVEVCMTSNVFTKKFVKKIEEHPIRKMYNENLFVTVNTDDPVFFKTTLLEEYWKLYKKLDFSLEEIKDILENGFKASFAPEDIKKKYLAELDRTWKEYLPQ